MLYKPYALHDCKSLEEEYPKFFGTAPQIRLKFLTNLASFPPPPNFIQSS
jgi:hypothetical protein